MSARAAMQANASKVKVVSGKCYFDEVLGLRMPIRAEGLSAGHDHVAAAMKETHDLPPLLLMWGANAACQLGNSKQSDLAVPTPASFATHYPLMRAPAAQAARDADADADVLPRIVCGANNSAMFAAP